MDALQFNINTTSYSTINQATTNVATATITRTVTAVYASTVVGIALTLPT